MEAICDPKQSSGPRFTTSPTHSGFTVPPGLQAVYYTDTPSCLCVAYVPVWKACLRWYHGEEIDGWETDWGARELKPGRLRCWDGRLGDWGLEAERLGPRGLGD